MESIATPPAQGHEASVTDRTEPAIVVENLEVTYNDIAIAVQGVSFTVQPGTVTVILGRNGAGKSTTLRAVAGFRAADDAEVTGGHIQYRGRSIAGMQPHQTCRAGIVLVPERNKVFERLTVADNLLIGRAGAGRDRSLVEVDEVLPYFPILQERYRMLAGLLSGGERQMLAIAQALLCAPDLLMVDELSMGLAPIVSGRLFELLRQLREELGLTVLLVEQNVKSSLQLANYVYVLENGRIVFEGEPTRLVEHEDIKEFYLGVGKETGERRSYRDVKQYTRTRRWYG